MGSDYVVTAASGFSFEDGGDRVRVLVPSEATGGTYSVVEWVVAASQPDVDLDDLDYGRHSHGTFEETFLVRSGSLEFLIGDEVVTLLPGDFVRVPPNTRHGYRNTSSAPVDLVVTFVPGGFEELFVKYRPGSSAVGPGFIEEATTQFGSSFG